MNEYMDSKELQQMKEQLAILTQRLDKETIINERLMRQAMETKASSLRRKVILECIITLIIIPYLIWVAPELGGMSIGLCTFACFSLVFSMGYYYYIYTHLRSDKFIQGDLLEARKDTLAIKKLYANWFKFISIPFTVVFFCWFTHDMIQASHGDALQFVLGAIAAGVAIGSIIEIYRYQKAQHTADEILEQIEELKEGL